MLMVYDMPIDYFKILLDHPRVSGTWPLFSLAKDLGNGYRYTLCCYIPMSQTEAADYLTSLLIRVNLPK